MWAGGDQGESTRAEKRVGAPNRSHGVVLRSGGGRRRRRLGNGVVVLLVDRVVEAVGGEGVVQALVHLRRVETEAELYAGPELVEIPVGDAPAPPPSAIGLLPEPRLVAVGVRGPRALLAQGCRRVRRRVLRLGRHRRRPIPAAELGGSRQRLPFFGRWSVA
ncbi:importin alpha isoform 4 [Striga asiatica]|uniref:Importin alpha isoform 4 n=1 Tax=Striga asiatica TaxID=4170 RepID=A0A5A7PE17_STRAF|nr:importin alpha isoform 4 [Striga asiatica]